MFKNKVTVILSAKNEEKTIGEIITGCMKYTNDVIVMDGHSTDETCAISKRLGAAIYLDGARGKGEAIRLGIEKAQKDILVFIDADGSHDPNDIPALIQPILNSEADLVIGSRARGGSDELHGDISKFIRTTGTDIITLGINYRFGVRLTDSQNGFRAIRRQVALRIRLKEDITTIEQEMIMKVLHNGFRVTEVPSHEYERRYGCSRFQVRKVWWRHVYTWIKYMFWR